METNGNNNTPMVDCGVCGLTHENKPHIDCRAFRTCPKCGDGYQHIEQHTPDCNGLPSLNVADETTGGNQ